MSPGATAVSAVQPPYRHAVCGLAVASDFPLPEQPRADDRDGAPDVCVRLGVVPEALSDVRDSGPFWQVRERAFLLEVPGVARFLARDGREVVVEPQPAAGDGDVAAFLFGTVIAAILHQRGDLVLHAATLLLDGRGVALCGRSGSGKSTLAAALCEAGGVLAGDDMAAVRFDADGAPSIAPDARRYRLWEEAAERLGLADRLGPRVRRPIAKYHVAPATAAAAATVPLDVIVALRPARRHPRPVATVVAAPDAAALVREDVYRPRLAGAIRAETALFGDVARLIARSRVILLEWSKDFAQLDEAAAAVVAACGSLPSRGSGGPGRA